MFGSLNDLSLQELDTVNGLMNSLFARQNRNRRLKKGSLADVVYDPVLTTLELDPTHAATDVILQSHRFADKRESAVNRDLDEYSSITDKMSRTIKDLHSNNGRYFGNDD